MGAWLFSLHVYSSDRALVRRAAEEVASELGIRFLLSPVKKGWIALLADFSTFSENIGAALALRVGGAPVFDCTVADDDDFRYHFYRDGRLVDRYCAAPDTFDGIPKAERPSWRGEPNRFADLFDSPKDVTACAELLRLNHRRFTFESQRLEGFARLLGLSHVLDAYEEPDESGAPDFPGAKNFVHVPDDSAAKTAARQRRTNIRGEYQHLKRTGLLRAEIKAPGSARERERLSCKWFFDSGDGALIVQWTDWMHPSPPAVRLLAPTYVGPQPLEIAGDWGRTSVCSLSRSGRWLALGHAGGDWSATLWEWPKAECGARISHERSVSWVGFDREEQLLLTAGPSDMVVSSVPDGRELARTHLDHSATAFALHPGGDQIVVGTSGGEIFIRDTRTLVVEKRLTTFRGVLAGGANPLAATGVLLQARPPELTGERFKAWMMRQADPEIFARLLFSPDGDWLFAGTSLGMRAFAWPELLAAADGPAPAPKFAAEAQPGSLGHHTYCHTLAFDESAQRLLFAGLEGVIEALDIRTGSIATLLRPPELLAIRQLALSPDGQSLAVQASEATMNSRPRTEYRIWNYPALCGNAGLRGTARA
jgi:hypothetical protein